MRTGNLLFSAVQLFVVVIILGLGAFLIGLAKAPHVKLLITELINSSSPLFSLLGYSMLLIGTILLFGFYAMNRGQYYKVKMKCNHAEVDVSIIQDYIEKYWKDILPEQEAYLDVILHRDQKLEIIARMSNYSFEQHKMLLEKIERDLGTLLSKNLGYNKEFLFTVVVK
jgi:hypothetical protein